MLLKQVIIGTLIVAGVAASAWGETYPAVRRYQSEIYVGGNTWVRTSQPSFVAAAAAAWNAWTEPSFWPGSVKQDWFTNMLYPMCQSKEERSFSTNGDHQTVWSTILYNGSVGCTSTNYDVVILLVCPSGGYLLGQQCTNAPGCLPGQVRSQVTGLCEINPKNKGPSGDCPSTDQGNPINSATGNKYQTERHYRSGGGFPLKLELTYNGLGDAHGSNWGLKWQSNWDTAVGMGQGPSSTVLGTFRPDGKVHQFSQSGAIWSTTADNPARLERLSDASGALSGWRHLSKRDEVESYDAAGRLLSIADRTGGAHTLAYDKLTRLYRVTDAFGRQLGFTYDGQGRIVAMTDPASQSYRYTYDASNNLASVAYPDATPGDDADNPRKTYHYGEAAQINGGVTCPGGNGFAGNLLTGITDENGMRYATYRYDCQGRAVSTEHWSDAVATQSAERYQLAYTTDANGNPVSTVVTDPLGTQRTYNFTTILGVVKSTGQSQPGGSGCGAASSVLTYDANGNVASRRDFNGNQTCYAYDLTRNLETRRVEGLPAGTNCTAALASPPAPTSANPVRTITTAWHPDWRLEVKRAEPLKLTIWIYNGQADPSAGNAIASCAPSTALLPDGKPIAVLCKKIEQATLDASGSQGFGASVTGTARTWKWTYNPYGQVLSEKGPRTDLAGAGDTTTYSYYSDTVFDANGAGHTTGDLWKISNAKGHVTETTLYDKNGHPLEIKDANGMITRLTYSPRGWLTSKSVGAASGTRELTRYDYDNVGQLKKLTNPDGSYLAYTWDDAHRLSDIGDALGNSIHYTLDAMGNRTKEEIKDPNGVLTRTQRRVYDALGRLQNLITPAQ